MGIFGNKANEKAEAERAARAERLRRMTEKYNDVHEPEDEDYGEFSDEESYLPEGLRVRDIEPAVKVTAGPFAVNPENRWPSDEIAEAGGMLPETDKRNKKGRKPAPVFEENTDSLFDEENEDEEISREEERELDEKEREEENGVVGRIREEVGKRFGDRILTELKTESFRTEVGMAVDDLLKNEAGAVKTSYDRERIRKRIMNLILGLGPLEDLFDKGYTEIMVSRWDRIFVEKNGKMAESGVKFGSEEELQSLIVQICGRIGKTINQTSTRVDGDLEDGSRFNAIFPPSSPDGANLTIRRFSDHKIQPEEYLSFGSADERMMTFLRQMVESGATMIASGGTGSGKTTLLNLLASFIPDDLSVLTIEDSLELKLPCTNWRRRLTRQTNGKEKMGEVTARDLVKNALRERPDRIVIGEIRDGTMVDFLDAANSGHDGCLTTVHANSPHGLTSRIISLFKKANVEGYGTDDIKRLYADAVQLIVQIKRYPDHTRKISHISHVVGFGAEAAEELGEKAARPNDVYIKDIFRWRPDGGKDENGRLTGSFVATGYVPEKLIELASDNGIEIDRSIFAKEAGEENTEDAPV